MYRDMGGALYFEGRYHDAAEMYRRCLALSPDDARAKHMLAACGVGDVPARASDDFVRALFDGYAPTFEASLARLDYRGPALVSEAVEAIAGDVPAQASVLDAGCGTGLCGPLLRPRAGRLVGVDLSSGMVALARERAVYDELVVEELTRHLGAHNRSYDIIASADTFEYFGDLREVLAAAASAMRSRGALVFTVERAGPEEAKPGYRLNPHGRYSHTRAYVAETLGQVGLLAVDIREVQLRKELHQWVAGYLVCARGPVLP
jgi:predicted TPR repeat methyltransferase